MESFYRYNVDLLQLFDWTHIKSFIWTSMTPPQHHKLMIHFLKKMWNFERRDTWSNAKMDVNTLPRFSFMSHNGLIPLSKVLATRFTIPSTPQGPCAIEKPDFAIKMDSVCRPLATGKIDSTQTSVRNGPTVTKLLNPFKSNPFGLYGPGACRVP